MNRTQNEIGFIKNEMKMMSKIVDRLSQSDADNSWQMYDMQQQINDLSRSVSNEINLINDEVNVVKNKMVMISKLIDDLSLSALNTNNKIMMMSQLVNLSGSELVNTNNEINVIKNKMIIISQLVNSSGSELVNTNNEINVIKNKMVMMPQLVNTNDEIDIIKNKTIIMSDMIDNLLGSEFAIIDGRANTGKDVYKNDRHDGHVFTFQYGNGVEFVKPPSMFFSMVYDEPYVACKQISVSYMGKNPVKYMFSKGLKISYPISIFETYFTVTIPLRESYFYSFDWYAYGYVKK